VRAVAVTVRRALLAGLLTLAACRGKDQPPARRPPRDGGFAITGRGAGANPGVLAGPPIDAAVDAALGMLAVPECMAVITMIDRCLATIDPAQADSVRTARQGILEAWTGVAIEINVANRGMVALACTQATDAMRQAFASMGCKDL